MSENKMSDSEIIKTVESKFETYHKEHMRPALQDISSCLLQLTEVVTRFSSQQEKQDKLEKELTKNKEDLTEIKTKIAVNEQKNSSNKEILTSINNNINKLITGFIGSIVLAVIIMVITSFIKN